MRNDKIIFSVIIPVYNEGEGIHICIRSFLRQNYNDFEVLLIDDGSTDCSKQICDEYAENYNFIKVIHKKNGGCIDARRTGVEHANGKYIIFGDADDYVENEYMENLHQAIKHQADYYILNNKMRIGTDETEYVQKKFLSDGYISREQAAEWILTGKAVAVWDKIYCSDIMKEYSILFLKNITFGDDVYINISYLPYVNKIYVQNTSSYVHIWDSPTSVCENSITFYRFKEIDVLYQEGIKFIRQMELSEEIKEKFMITEIKMIVRTMAELVNIGKESAEIKKELNQYLIVKDGEKLKGNNIKSKIYIFLLRNRMIKISAWICNWRKYYVRIRNRV